MARLPWVKITDRLPEIGRLVYTLDTNKHISAYTLTEHGWNSMIDESNAAIVEWLDSVPTAVFDVDKRKN